jgi:tetratricopeptide (TPR) repeat protein
VVSSAGLAVAQEGEGRELTPEQKEAGRLFDIADSHYAAGRYEEAAEYFERGYAIAPHPEFLYSLGNTYERMGEYGKAADYLKRYLESPEAQDVVSVKERVRRLEAAAEKQLAAETLSGAGGEPAPPAVSGPEPAEGAAEVPPSRRPYYWFAGAGLGVTGAVVFGLISRSAGSAAGTDCADGGFCDRAAEDALARERRFAVLSDVSLVIGLAAAGVGAYEWIRDRRSRRAARSSARIELAPMFAPGTVGLAAGARF